MSAVFKEEYAIISIREYEDKFTDKETEHNCFNAYIVKTAKELLESAKNMVQVPSSYNLYPQGKHLIGRYSDKVIIINQDKLIIEKDYN